MPKAKTPPLPPFLETKLSKTRQTRGADDDVIYQNRVSRNNTVLIDFDEWHNNEDLRSLLDQFDKGYIVLIPPQYYFTLQTPDESLKCLDLILGENCLVFYQTRSDWNDFDPGNLGWRYANRRKAPLGGNYVARVPANTSKDALNAKEIKHGFTTSTAKGAGIRPYEFASKKTLDECRLQLEALFWLCKDSIDVVVNSGMTHSDAEFRKRDTLEKCQRLGLLDYNMLKQKRIINARTHTICPLCLKELSGEDFLSRLAQPEGRITPDLTITRVSLFHIDALNNKELNHRQYNLGWGHHHCNVVAKDSGIYPTLKWMKQVLQRNTKTGYAKQINEAVVV